MTLPWWAFKVAGMADSSGGLISPVAIQRPLQAPLHVCTYPASATQPDSSGVAYVSGCAKQHLYDCKLTVRLHTHSFSNNPFVECFQNTVHIYYSSTIIYGFIITQDTETFKILHRQTQ